MGHDEINRHVGEVGDLGVDDSPAVSSHGDGETLVWGALGHKTPNGWSH